MTSCSDLTCIPSVTGFDKMVRDRGDNIVYTATPAELETGYSMHNNEQPQRTPDSLWIVYIVRCRDSSYYTGITTNLTRRIAEHNSVEGGAKYTRPRRPVTLVYSEAAPSRATATQRENQIKKLSAAAKAQLIVAEPSPGIAKNGDS